MHCVELICDKGRVTLTLVVLALGKLCYRARLGLENWQPQHCAMEPGCVGILALGSLYYGTLWSFPLLFSPSKMLKGLDLEV